MQKKIICFAMFRIFTHHSKANIKFSRFILFSKILYRHMGDKKLKNTAKKRVIFFDSNKCNFLKHSKLVKFSQITLLNVNAQNEKIIFWLKIFKFNLKLWILKTEKN
jgi:hypothetical protein